MRAHEFIRENMDHHSQQDDPVDELKSALLAQRSQIQAAQGDGDRVYDIIDHLMTAVARAHRISGQRMHDMWVNCYHEIPDTWIMHQTGQDLDELDFMGSPCTKDCSGHRAGYRWSQRKGGRVAQSPRSPSFNKGSQLYVDNK